MPGTLRFLISNENRISFPYIWFQIPNKGFPQPCGQQTRLEQPCCALSRGHRLDGNQ